MSETQDGNQIEQDEIAQFEGADQMRSGLFASFSHKPQMRAWPIFHGECGDGNLGLSEFKIRKALTVKTGVASSAPCFFASDDGVRPINRFRNQS